MCELKAADVNHPDTSIYYITNVIQNILYTNVIQYILYTNVIQYVLYTNVDFEN